MGKDNKPYTTKSFIIKANSVHLGEYNYSLVNYVNSKTKVKIICHIHGVFEQRPSPHINGQGCPKCRYIKSGKSNSLLSEGFIIKAKEVHGDKYDYSLVEYINNKTKVKIICPIHGEFEQTPTSHIRNKGCQNCFGSGGGNRLTINEFIDRSNHTHKYKYDYSLVDYNTIYTKVKIICHIHGVFEQIPKNHMNGSGCPKCIGIVSKQEMDVVNYIKSIYNGKMITNTKKVITPYEIDIYLPDINTAFEYNGRYWHIEGVTKPIGYHQMKTDMCKEQGITLHHIWENDWRTDKYKLYNNIKEKIYNKV